MERARNMPHPLPSQDACLLHLKKGTKIITAYLLVQMVIAPFMRLELVDPTVPFATQIAVERFSRLPR